MNFIRYIASHFGFQFVILFDLSGEESVRLLRHYPSGRAYAKRYGFGIRNVLLADDGSCPGGVYVERWQRIWKKSD